MNEQTAAPAFTLHGYRHFAPYEDTADTLEEAILTARWAVDDNTWCVLEIRDQSGGLVMERGEIMNRAFALSDEEANG